MKIKWSTVWKKTVICLAFGGLGILGWNQYKQEQLAEALALKIIRFHREMSCHSACIFSKERVK